MPTLNFSPSISNIWRTLLKVTLSTVIHKYGIKSKDLIKGECASKLLYGCIKGSDKTASEHNNFIKV